MPQILLQLFFLLWIPACTGSVQKENFVMCGADQTEVYLTLLSGRRIAVMANQTSVVGKTHLVDTMVSMGLNVKKIFAAEHGFRGNEADGILITDGKDTKTGIPIISLYGKSHKPTSEMLADIDIIVFDIQDVGVRFYTFISSMHYLMEACAENNIEFLVLDRPNPNGNYIDGPVLLKEFSSFIGMHPVPVVHGMTIAEYARMINGEGWLSGGRKCRLSWIPCRNYNHNMEFTPPIPPSPNLPDIQSIRLYPSIAFFEGTVVSEGRGTAFPFQIFGYPGFPDGEFEFTPKSISGMAANPKFENQLCRGKDLRKFIPANEKWDHIYLEWLIDTYKSYNDKPGFFKPYFDKLAGTDQFRNDIISGRSAEQIKAGWAKDLEVFRLIREKYLIYD